MFCRCVIEKQMRNNPRGSQMTRVQQGASQELLQIRFTLSNVKETCSPRSFPIKIHFFFSGLKVTLHYAWSLRNSMSSSCLSWELGRKKMEHFVPSPMILQFKCQCGELMGKDWKRGLGVGTPDYEAEQMDSLEVKQE